MSLTPLLYSYFHSILQVFSNRLQSSRADRKWFPAGQEQLVQSDGHWLHFRVEEMYRTEIVESVCLW